MKLEAKIGLFVLMALGALLVLSTQVTSLGKWGQRGYPVQAYVKDASGIEKNTKVLMNGVGIGEVESITIEGKQVKLTLLINEGVKIPEDSSVMVVQESLLGSKVLNIVVGDSAQTLQAGGSLSQAKEFASFDQTSDSVNAAAKEFELLLHDFRETLDEEHRSAIQEAIVAFRDFGVNLDGVIIDNRNDLRAAIANFKTMSAGFGTTADTINKDLPAIMARINSLSTRLDTISGNVETTLPDAITKFNTIEDNISTILAENKTPIKDTITSVNMFFKSAEEAVNKIDAMLAPLTSSELQVAMHTDYMMRDGYAKIYLGATYLPNPETYYMVDLISADDYSNPYQLPGKHIEGSTRYSLQYGKRFDDLLLRFGAIESTGGIGADYFMNHNRLKFSAEAFDFNAVNDLRSDQPHLKAQVRYQMLKHLEFYGGWDNFLNSGSQNLFLGLGARFIDNDLKYIFGSASSMKR